MADKQTLLVVEDDPNLAEMLTNYFNIQGYRVLTFDWGEDAVRTCQLDPPQLALLDVRLPDIDGYEVARRLRTHRRTQTIPLIFLTERNARSDRLRGLELGAVDYITKPFDLKELQLRVRNALHRARLSLLVNSVTGLPEGEVVDEWLNALLPNTHWTLVRASLEGLDQFRASYGFLDSDSALRVMSVMLRETVREAGVEHDLVGHLSDEALIVITSATQARRMCQQFQARFESFLENFYPLEARLAGDRPRPTLALKLGVLSAPTPAFKSLAALKTAAQEARYN